MSSTCSHPSRAPHCLLTRIGCVTCGTTQLSFRRKGRDAERSAGEVQESSEWVVPHSVWTLFTLQCLSPSPSSSPPSLAAHQSPVFKATLKMSRLPDLCQVALSVASPCCGHWPHCGFAAFYPECLPSEDRNYSVHSPQA